MIILIIIKKEMDIREIELSLHLIVFPLSIIIPISAIIYIIFF